MNINLTEIEIDLKSPQLVSDIYEVRDNENENGNYITEIIINETILDIIDKVNFIYVKNGLEPTKEIKKVGYLMDLQVYLDPDREDNFITFINDKKESFNIDIIL